jgi:hypothetical protein
MKSKKMRGGELSQRTKELLRNQYNGLSGIERRTPTILELDQFLKENKVEESFEVVMDNIVELLHRLLSPLPDDLTPEQRQEVDRLVARMRSTESR